MNKLTNTLVVAAAALLVGGCLPEDSLWWSPDGQTAAVRTADGLQLAGANGQLSPVVLPGVIRSVAWLPDSSGLVVSRSYTLASWGEVEALIPREEAAATIQMASAIPDLLKAGLTAAGGSLDDLDEKFLTPLGLKRSAALEPAWYCALNLHRDRIRAAIGGFTNAAAMDAELRKFATNGISIYEISVLSLANGRPVGEPRALARSLHPLLNPVLSPHHPLVAFQTGEGGLKAMTLDGESSLLVASGTDVRDAAWSADGCALIHVVMGQSDQAGELRRSTVVDDNGELLPNTPTAETLAMAVFGRNTAPRLSVLPDGRLLFASVPVTLPARAASIHPGAQFFLLDLAKPEAPAVPVQIKEGSLPDDLRAFAPSPDGHYVAVVEGATDAVAVLELATGKVKIISPPHGGWKSRLVPAWKSRRELTFAALPSATATRPELILWQPDAPQRVLSKSWSDDVVKPWLEAPRSAGQ